MRILFFCMLLSLIGCDKARNEASQVPAQGRSMVAEAKSIDCGESAKHLALERLFPLLGMGQISNHLDVWISNDYSDAHWQPIFSEQQSKLDSLKTWAESLPDRCAKNSYLHWIEYYQVKLDGAKSELRTHSDEKEMAAYEADRQREKEQTKKFEEAVDGSFPSPKVSQ